MKILKVNLEELKENTLLKESNKKVDKFTKFINKYLSII
jgi:hypothetical protein